jgi:hypothetical protein
MVNKKTEEIRSEEIEKRTIDNHAPVIEEFPSVINISSLLNRNVDNSKHKKIMKGLKKE